MKPNRLFAGLAGLLVAPVTLAQSPPPVTVYWEPLAEPYVPIPVPTMGTWGLIIAGLMLAALGIRFLRSNQHVSRALSVLLVVGGVSLSAGMAINGHALPIPSYIVQDEECEGGSLDYDPFEQVLFSAACEGVKIVKYEGFENYLPDGIKDKDKGPDAYCIAGVQESCPVGTTVGNEAPTDADCILNHLLFCKP